MAQHTERHRLVAHMFTLLAAAMLSLTCPALSEGFDSAFIQPTTRVIRNRTWFGVKSTPDAVTGGRNQVQGSRDCLPTPRRRWVPEIARSASKGITMDAGPPRIIIAGAPASGKGTQCSMIKERYGVVHLSTGDMLRQAVKDETEVGMKAKGFMDEGKLVPDQVIIDIVSDRLSESDCQEKGWLLDGFPRTRAQADALEAAGVKADIFLLLNVPDDVLVARVVGRRLDPVTNEIYHLEFSPPPADIVDRLVHRADDTEDKARVRLDAYYANIEAIRECYEDITASLDGARPKSEVFESITTEIDTKAGAAASLRGGAILSEESTEPIEGMMPGTSGLRKKE